MTHWADDLIGAPYEPGVSDCWHFAVRLWRERWGWDVPAVPVDPHDLRAVLRAMADADRRRGWLPVAVPAEGDAVLMRRGRHPSHVGVWIDVAGGAVLHAVASAGVLCTAPGRLSDVGFSVSGFYRWGQACGRS